MSSDTPSILELDHASQHNPNFSRGREHVHDQFHQMSNAFNATASEFRSAPTQMQELDFTKQMPTVPDLSSQKSVEMMKIDSGRDDYVTQQVKQLPEGAAAPIEHARHFRQDAGRSGVDVLEEPSCGEYTKEENDHVIVSREQQQSFMDSYRTTTVTDEGESVMGEVKSTTSEQVSMSLVPEGSKLSLESMDITHQEQQNESVPRGDLAFPIPTASPSHDRREIAVPRLTGVANHSADDISSIEARLAHASECTDSRCHYPQCSNLKAEIAHCLHHDMQYKKCDRCTSIGGICVYHYRTCSVPLCSFFYCKILKMKFSKQRAQEQLVCPDNILYKDPVVLLCNGSFIENHHYAVITPKVVGRGQNGNVCEVEVFQPIVEGHAQQFLHTPKICMKKCKYRVEEIDIIERVRGHPNIIQTLIILQSSDQMLVFMPRVTCSLLHWKGSLDKEMKNPSVYEVFGVAKDVTCALVFMHGHGIVHRDIKAANILLDVQQNRCRYKICDFGHAKYIGVNGLTPPCPNCGTKGFRAPEIVKNEAHGCKVDVYALGITLLHLALPFDYNQQYQLGVTNSSMLQYLPYVGDIIERCYQDDVKQRPSALQLMQDVSLVQQLL